MKYFSPNFVIFLSLFLFSCSSSDEVKNKENKGELKKEINSTQETVTGINDFEDVSSDDKKTKEAENNPSTENNSSKETVIQKETLSIENIPSGSYTLAALIEALEDIRLNGEGKLLIYDDRGEIKDLVVFEHDPGDIEFTFVAKDVNDEVILEIEETITLKSDSGEAKEEEEEEEKVVVDPGYEKKAILIVVDGVNYSTLSGLSLENFDGLYKSKAYTGGIIGDGSEQKTLPEVGWASILTGVWANKHGIKSSTDKSVNADFKSIFSQLYAHFQTKGIDLTQSSIIRSAHLKSDYFNHDLEFIAKGSQHAKDSEAVDAAIEKIKNETDFIFLQLGDVAKAASGGLGSEYQKNLKALDEQLGHILAAIKSSGHSDRLLIMTSSHGVTTNGDSGGQLPDEKTVFIASNENLNEEFSMPLDGYDKTLSKLYSQPSVTSIAPTLLSHFGVSLHRDLKLDGPSLLGTLGVQKLMLDKAAKKLTWRSTSSDDIDIYNNGKRVGSVEANKEQWVLSDLTEGENDFVFLLNDHPVSYRYQHAREYTEVLAAMDWDREGGNYDYEFIFLFFDNDYVARIRKGDLGLDDVFKLGDSGLFDEMKDFSETVSANVPWDIDIWKSYFLYNNGQKYSRYDRDDGTFDDDPPKDNDWDELGPYKGLITAACMTSDGGDDDAYFFLRDSRYFIYDVADEDIESGPTNTHSGWDLTEQEGKDITACVRLSSTLHLFFLKGGRIIKYNNKTNDKLPGYPKNLEDEWSRIR